MIKYVSNVIIRNYVYIFFILKFYKFFLIVLLFALFASIFSLQKKNLDYAEPFFLIGIRMTIAGILLLSYFFFKYNLKLIFKASNLKFFFWLSIFNIYLTNIFELWGLKNMSSAKACMIYSLSPFINVLFACFILNEFITKKKIFGLIFGFLGIIPMIIFKTKDEQNVASFFAFSLAEVSLLFSVFFSVLGWIFLKKIINLNCSFILANGFSMFFGGILILIHSFIFGENWNPFPILNTKYFLFYTLITLIVSNLICYNLFGYLLKFFSTTFMTFCGLITPFFAGFWGWIFLNEIITLHFFISILCFFIGLYIFYKEENI